MSSTIPTTPYNPFPSLTYLPRDAVKEILFYLNPLSLLCVYCTASRYKEIITSEKTLLYQVQSFVKQVTLRVMDAIKNQEVPVKTAQVASLAAFPLIKGMLLQQHTPRTPGPLTLTSPALKWKGDLLQLDSRITCMTPIHANQVLLGHASGAINLLDIHDDSSCLYLTHMQNRCPLALLFYKNRKVIIADNRKTLSLLSLDTPEVMQPIGSSNKRVTSLCLLQDRLVVGSEGYIHQWDLRISPLPQQPLELFKVSGSIHHVSTFSHYLLWGNNNKMHWREIGKQEEKKTDSFCFNQELFCAMHPLSKQSFLFVITQSIQETTLYCFDTLLFSLARYPLGQQHAKSLIIHTKYPSFYILSDASELSCWSFNGKSD